MTLIDSLQQVKDPRRGQGLRYSSVAMLTNVTVARGSTKKQLAM
jgi:hypothetical protein